MNARRQPPSSEAGFTIIELLAAMVVGLMVLMAAFMLLDHATSASNRLSDRQDAVQRGRQALELMTRQLRSQVCLGDTTEPITYGDGNAVRFYADLSDGSRKRPAAELKYDPAAKTITESACSGVGTYPTLTFGGGRPPARADQGRAHGRGHRHPSDLPLLRVQDRRRAGRLQQLSVPLNSDDASRTYDQCRVFAMPDRFGARRPRRHQPAERHLRAPRRSDARPTEGPRCL